jgi:LacI family transcriptional regulator
MAITMVEIARRTNLSPATVSRVLNGKGVGFISATTRQRVLEVARELGYEPNRLARGLVTGRTQVIGAWVRNPDRPYYSRILRCLLESAAKGGYDMIVTPVHDQIPGALDPVGGTYIRENAWTSWPSDGVFAADCPSLADSYIKRFSPGACPLVGLSSDYSAQTDYVAFDVACGVRQAVEHLVSIGCRRIAHLSSLVTINQVRAARAGTYEEVLAAAGLAPEIILAPNESRAASRSTIVDYVRAHGAPDGLFCLNDDMAIGAYRGLRDLGLRIPEDVALVGCDGIDDVQYLDVPLTTIVQPVQEMCRTAWDVLMRRIENPTASLQQVLLKPELRIDASTKR